MTHDDADGGTPSHPWSDEAADADSWVAQWAQLHGETVARAEPGTGADPEPDPDSDPDSGPEDSIEYDPDSGPEDAPDFGQDFDLDSGPEDVLEPDPDSDPEEYPDPDPTPLHLAAEAQPVPGGWAAPPPQDDHDRRAGREVPPVSVDRSDRLWGRSDTRALTVPGPSEVRRPIGSARRRGVVARPQGQRLGLLAGGMLALVVGLVGYLFVSFGQRAPEIEQVEEVPFEPELSLTVGAAANPATIDQLIASTVQIVGLDADLRPQCAGSGIIVDTGGAILTNAHVVASTDSCRFSEIGIAVTVDPTLPPELLYLAEVDLLRPSVDLALLQISGPLPGRDVTVPQSFRPAPLGDSDTVTLGDAVRILGYPVIGGETITLTTGTVSGFTSQAGLGSRALIKTDASISAGNSGGLAVDADGRVIGIPTKARASERGPAVDCRPVDDTNQDGSIDDDDACVSVGGFLNGIRPINLSLPLLAAAGVSDPVGPVEPAPLRPTIDLSEVALFHPRFALGVSEDDSPIEEVVTAAAGIPELCFFVDWDGIPAGAGWDGVWYVDNQAQEGRAYTGRIWERDESGQYFWLCIEADDEAGLAAGIYEIAFFLDGQVAFVEGIEVTPEPVELVPVVWKNEIGVELCGLAVNPQAQSGQLGLNELPVGEAIPVDGEWQVDMPLGSVVIEAYDCQDEPVANRFDGLPIDGPVTLNIRP